jgi:hypothetical protein
MLWFIVIVYLSDINTPGAIYWALGSLLWTMVVRLTIYRFLAPSRCNLTWWVPLPWLRFRLRMLHFDVFFWAARGRMFGVIRCSSFWDLVTPVRCLHCVVATFRPIGAGVLFLWGSFWRWRLHGAFLEL